MKKFFVSLAAYVGFLICLVMQVYLAILLTTTNAWAQTEEVKEPVKKEVVVEKVEKTETIEKVAKKRAFPFKDMKLDKNSFKMTIDDGSGKDEKVDIDLGSLVEKAGKVRRERTIWDNMEDVVVPIALFGMTFGIMYMVHLFRFKTKKEQMDTIKIMVEKGQPIPPGIFALDDKTTWLGQMNRGLKLSGVGLGLAIFLYTVDGPWAVGAIPFFAGVAQIISAKMKQKHEGK
jgi:hypothetical protein